MKKIIAFLTAFLLFAATITGMHIHAEKKVSLKNNAFGTWMNEAKFSSREGICRNINAHTLVAFGSSEFMHGQDLPFYPKEVFQGQEFNTMLIGAGYYQSLSHAITLASIEESMENRQVVLFVSPQWFRKTGVIDKAFASRFSENQYLGMLHNEKLSDETKAYIYERTEKLLEADKEMQKRVRLYQKMADHKEYSLTDMFYYKVYTSFLQEKDIQGVTVQMQKDGLQYAKNEHVQDKEIDWSALLERAERQGESENEGEDGFYMDSKAFKKCVKPNMAKKKDQSRDAVRGYAVSPEYDDLRCFLQVCRELSVKPMLVEIPVNGYWYDYTGFPQQARQNYYENIRQIAAEYDAELADFSDQEYTKYFFEDGIHLGRKGWVMVNESLYKFYQQNQG